MKSKKLSSKTVKIPGLGTFVPSPDRVRSKSGTMSVEKFLKSIQKARKDKLLPPVEHAFA